MFGKDRNKTSHAMGKMGGGLGVGLPSPKPEEPLDTNASAEMPFLSPEPKSKQHAMTDRENSEDKTPFGDTFGTPDPVDPWTKGAPPEESGTPSKDESTGGQDESAPREEPKSFLGLQFEEGAASLKHKYFDIFEARTEDKAEIERRNNIKAEDSLTFGLSGPGYDPYRQLHISKEEYKKINPTGEYDEDFNMTRNQANLDKKDAERRDKYQKAMAKYPDYIRLSPLAMIPQIMEEVADPLNWLPLPIKGLSTVGKVVKEVAEVGGGAAMGAIMDEEEPTPTNVAEQAGKGYPVDKGTEAVEEGASGIGKKIWNLFK